MTVLVPQPTPATIQERYASRVKARLERPELTAIDARDGILDCFLATYYQGVTLGLKSIAAIEGGEDEVARVTAAMFRKRLRLHGTTFEAPTLDALALVKDEVDRELHVVDLPAEIRGVHDQVCTLLLAKADGMLPHRPGRSVAEAGAATSVAMPATPPPAARATGTGERRRRPGRRAAPRVRASPGPGRPRCERRCLDRGAAACARPGRGGAGGARRVRAERVTAALSASRRRRPTA